MMRFHVLVADDEPLARSMVASLLRGDADIDRVTECGQAACVRQALARDPVDIAFLDIEMPEISGLELARSFGPQGPVVVFVTAFQQYAPSAFDIQAVDYVTKPFSDARFAEAIDRAKRRVRERQLWILADQLASLSAGLRHGDTMEHPPASVAPKKLALKQGDRTIVLSESAILWIEAEDYYVLVHTVERRHLIRASLAAMEQRLSARQFVRVHRGALVNIDAVRELIDGGSALIMTNGTTVPVSRSRRPGVEAVFAEKFGPRV